MPLVMDDVLASAAKAAPSRVAATLLGDAITFSEMRERSHRLANALVGLGVRRHDRVAHWADISLDIPPLNFALGRIGAVFAPLNAGSSDEEARAVVEYLHPRLLVADRAHTERAAALARDLDVPFATMGARGPGVALDELAAAAAPSPPTLPGPDEHDIFTIFLTSGSTGRPKGAMVSHRATWLRTQAGWGTDLPTSSRSSAISFPLFHMAGWFFALHAWSTHQAAHFVPRADAELLLQAVEQHSVGSLYCIPAVWQRILEEKQPRNTDSLEWALTGTSRIEVDLFHAIKARFPATRTTVGYGSTEVGRALVLFDEDLFRKPESVGSPVPNLRARIADDGELMLASDTLMSGYFDLPNETDEALSDGWYHSGDLAERDDDGYYWIVGRKREIIRSGGESVAPVEVEAVLADYPGLADVAVVGLPDRDWGEVVCAAVVLTGASPAPSVDDLRRHIGGRLASFKHPRRVIVVDELPRTSATGQVQRTRLALQVARR